MKHLLLTILLALTSCSKHEGHETTDEYPTVDEIAAGYLEQMKGLDDETLFPDRCDRLTFLSLASGFVSRRDLSSYEYEDGQWHRHTSPCYPDDSRSEISFDGLIGVLHHAWTSNDRTLIDRMAAYGRANDWVMGEGPREYTFLPQVGLITDDMLGHMNLTNRPAYTLDSSHKEHLLVLSAWLKLRYAGFIEDHEILILKNLPKSPLGDALLARLKDGSQSKSILYLSKYPEKLPLETGEQEWSGCPKYLYFFLIKAVVDGN